MIHIGMPLFMMKHSKLTSALDQLTTMLVSSSEEPLYTAVVEQCGIGGGTAKENHRSHHIPDSSLIARLSPHPGDK